MILFLYRLASLGLLAWGVYNTERTRRQMAEIADDEQRLEADVEANTQAIAQVGQIVQQDKQTIADLRGQLDAQKAQGVDTTALEAALTKLEGNNAALQGIVPAGEATAA